MLENQIPTILAVAEVEDACLNDYRYESQHHHRSRYHTNTENKLVLLGVENVDWELMLVPLSRDSIIPNAIPVGSSLSLVFLMIISLHFLPHSLFTTPNSPKHSRALLLPELYLSYSSICVFAFAVPPPSLLHLRAPFPPLSVPGLSVLTLQANLDLLIPSFPLSFYYSSQSGSMSFLLDSQRRCKPSALRPHQGYGSNPARTVRARKGRFPWPS